MKKIALISSLALLSACSLIPDYERPDMPVSSAWPEGPATKQEGPEASGKSLWADTAWKEFFTDPTLQGIIQKALDNNRDLRVAALNIQVARAAYRVSEADLLPTVTAGGNGTEQHTPKGLSQSVPKQEVTARQYNANVGITAFELDLFGRVRSLNEQALESYFSTEEARTSTQIALIAEVANAYLTLLGDRKQLALADETLGTRLKSLELIERSLEQGMSNELDRAQARSAVETARASQARYLRQVDQDVNALSLLVGTQVTPETTGGRLDGVSLIEDLPVGLPSDILLRRPDVMQAEHALKAANANIGAARAAFFPKVTLTGSLGYASPTLSSLFESGSGAWSFGPSIDVPIFDAGRNQANLDSAKASRDIAVAHYEKAIQTAFREVSDGLAARGTLLSQMNAQASLVAATESSYRLSEARYRQGVDSYLNVLDAERSLFTAQQDLIQIQVQRLGNLVTLYKVLGGGRS
ncbi:MAG TPA: efflux transporter outer membrane subunit [Candidatus Sulfotelmatobacter sp.]|jgi:multidrug efflux system outer membrane protein|nr:efflux transporter outer membrane subunit [Candidatus Sulfotelmatobacter sp.]